MATKSQHSPAYQRLPSFLRTLREEADLTQRELGERLDKPQSWVHNCETANRRVDVTEFIDWARACGVAPQAAFARFLDSLPEQVEDGE
jgi:transcriptional regulator with XRE-family HTH domain